MSASHVRWTPLPACRAIQRAEVSPERDTADEQTFRGHLLIPAGRASAMLGQECERPYSANARPSPMPLRSHPVSSSPTSRACSTAGADWEAVVAEDQVDAGSDALNRRGGAGGGDAGRHPAALPPRRRPAVSGGRSGRVEPGALGVPDLSESAPAVRVALLGPSRGVCDVVGRWRARGRPPS